MFLVLFIEHLNHKKSLLSKHFKILNSDFIWFFSVIKTMNFILKYRTNCNSVILNSVTGVEK